MQFSSCHDNQVNFILPITMHIDEDCVGPRLDTRIQKFQKPSWAKPFCVSFWWDTKLPVPHNGQYIGHVSKCDFSNFFDLYQLINQSLWQQEPILSFQGCTFHTFTNTISAWDGSSNFCSPTVNWSRYLWFSGNLKTS